MTWYLCNSGNFVERKGQVRDNPYLEVLKCLSCGLVTLSSYEHLRPKHYIHSRMHEDQDQTMEQWLSEIAEDDQRRIDNLLSTLQNKRDLDFGCGNGGFLQKAENFAMKVAGVELESMI